MKPTHENIIVTTTQGELPAQAPVIISASRRTDIPAFYQDWFMHRLRTGYVKWINPNSSKHQFISFAKTRVIVFWSKNPFPVCEHLPELDAMGLNYYFTYTLNGYEQENLEPNLPSLRDRIDTFKRLSDTIGKGRVIWRFDPLILSDTITVDSLLEKIYNIGKHIHSFTEKLVISFIDINKYYKVKRNLAKAAFEGCKEFTVENIATIAQGLQDMNRQWNITTATCSEEADLSEFGIIHNKCIDDALMIRQFGHDKALMEFLGYPSLAEEKKVLKDAGQRKTCGCILSKDIGFYGTCPHICTYCYANSSPERALGNYRNYKSKPFGDTFCIT